MTHNSFKLPSRPPGPNEAAADLERQPAPWRSPRMRELPRIEQQAAAADVTVLICGETGTGKHLVARAIHHLSSRRDRRFIRMNCGAVSCELLESELFVHERVAFTGAHQLKIGMFEAAAGGRCYSTRSGTLIPRYRRSSRVSQDETFSRVSGKSIIAVDVRVLAAT